APGALPGNTAPGTLPGNTLPGTLPGSTLPGAPSTQPGYTLPGNNAPGAINPNSPYNNGANLPGTSTNTPQVGGMTNDPATSEQPWKKVPSRQGDTPASDPGAGRTRPLLKASPVPGKIDVYNVHLHDTLWIIAQKYKIKLDALIDANPELTDPDLIYPGDQIKAPLDPSVNEILDIADSNTDKGDGGASLRSNIAQDRYSGAAPQQTQENAEENAEEKELLDLVNNERAKAGLPSLKLSAAVSTAARIKADEMCAKKYFNHTSPVYGSPFEMLRAFGIIYRTAGENIAKGQKTARAVVGAWMNSQGHKDNILNADFKEVGVGYASDGKITYWALIFIGK
ncbi:MAG: CAP domain-containing protein, partial [Clostridiales bacterium]|nr:CAP domain-containing protein [Clostridiales bacterium]